MLWDQIEAPADRLDLKPPAQFFYFSTHIRTSTTQSLISYFPAGNISVGFTLLWERLKQIDWIGRSSLEVPSSPSLLPYVSVRDARPRFSSS